MSLTVATSVRLTGCSKAATADARFCMVDAWEARSRVHQALSFGTRTIASRAQSCARTMEVRFEATINSGHHRGLGGPGGSHRLRVGGFYGSANGGFEDGNAPAARGTSPWTRVQMHSPPGRSPRARSSGSATTGRPPTAHKSLDLAGNIPGAISQTIDDDRQQHVLRGVQARGQSRRRPDRQDARRRGHRDRGDHYTFDMSGTTQDAMGWTPRATRSWPRAPARPSPSPIRPRTAPSGPALDEHRRDRDRRHRREVQGRAAGRR